ncbi:Uncharacterised protein [Sphingobacterium spiritivorum]|uniref:Uncharacterized protein n=1 Tax=Sphingobacterium spiritivorum TaxID=258 RepID=A0A380C1K4_SPHSI|nr:Uncharacterised protein [Sphingobacterium spiritivorum]
MSIYYTDYFLGVRKLLVGIKKTSGTDLTVCGTS